MTFQVHTTIYIEKHWAPLPPKTGPDPRCSQHYSPSFVNNRGGYTTTEIDLIISVIDITLQPF